MTKIVMDKEYIETAKKKVGELTEELDAIVSNFVMKQDDDDSSVPFVILSAISNVLLKVAIILDCDRTVVLKVLNELIPSDDELRYIAYGSENSCNVVLPESDQVH